MRPSNRSNILDAAVRVIQSSGVTGVTFDSVAAEAEVTRGGMMYHFPSREALIQAIHEHLAGRWEASLEATAAKPVAATTEDERAAAYTQICADTDIRAELFFLLHSTEGPGSKQCWTGVLERWAAPAPVDVHDTEALVRFIARLAADGLWIHQSLTGKPLPQDLRDAVARHIVGIAHLLPNHGGMAGAGHAPMGTQVQIPASDAPPHSSD